MCASACAQCWHCCRRVVGDSIEISFAFSRARIHHDLRVQKFQFILTFRIHACIRESRKQGKCASARDVEFRSKLRIASEYAMSRGTLRSEWQYTLGLITRNYRLLNLDIRHMCAFNQSSGTGESGTICAFCRFQFPGYIALGTPGSLITHTYHIYRHCTVSDTVYYSANKGQF